MDELIERPWFKKWKIILIFISGAIQSAVWILGIIFVVWILKDSRPGNLTGKVECEAFDQPGGRQVILELDDDAVRQRSSLDIISSPPGPELKPGETEFMVDYGAADGSIQGCGTNKGLIRFYITGQMISYPCWLKLQTNDPVNVQIIDKNSKLLASPLNIAPGQSKTRVKWY